MASAWPARVGVCLFAGFAWACGGSGPATPSGPPTPPATDSSFFSLDPGRTWNYDDGSTLKIAADPMRLEFSRDGVVFWVIYAVSDSTGIAVSKEIVWVSPDNYTVVGTNTPGFVQSIHLWNPSFYLLKWGMKLGDTGHYDVNKDEEIQVPGGRDGVTGGCATSPWTDWKFVHQFQSTTITDNERVTVPAGTFDTVKVVILQGETNNPFNPCNVSSNSSQTYWLSPGVGPVQAIPPGSDRTIRLVSRS